MRITSATDSIFGLVAQAGYFDDEDWYGDFPQNRLKKDKLAGKTTHLGQDESGHHYFYVDDGDEHRIDVTGKSGAAAGLKSTLSWDKNSGTISGVSTHPGFTRRGLAGRAFSVARALSAQHGYAMPGHDDPAWRTDSGNQWAYKVGEDPDPVELTPGGFAEPTRITWPPS